MAGWLYVQVRPNIGTVSGGAFVYGPGAWGAWEQPYYAYQQFQAVPDPFDLRDVTFPNGVSVRCLESGQSYDLGYRFRDHTEFTAALHFEGLTAPVPHLVGAPPFVGGSSHFDQHGRVTGELQLLGETIPVDCIAVRDRSWGRRPEHVGRSGGRLSYVFGSTSDDEAFLVFCRPDGSGEDREQLSTGYLLRDGSLQRLASATRINHRDAVTGGIDELIIQATDEAGRRLHVSGTAMSRFALVTNHLCVNTFLRFDVDGRVGHGEDQDVWAIGEFADHLKLLSAAAVR